MLIKNAIRSTLLLIGLILMISSCGTSSRSTNKGRTAKSPTSSSTSKNGKLRKSITTYAGKLQGTKYKYGGVSPKGFDCSGLTHYVFDNFNIAIPRGSYNQAKVGKKVSLRQARPGDLVFFGKGSKVNHVALVVKNGSSGVQVIHSTSSRGVIIENISTSSYWKTRILYARNVLL